MHDENAPIRFTMAAQTPEEWAAFVLAAPIKESARVELLKIVIESAYNKGREDAAKPTISYPAVTEPKETLDLQGKNE